MKSPRKTAQVLSVQVPEPLKGRRDAIFFLLNEIEQRKKRLKEPAQPETPPAQTEASQDSAPSRPKAFLLTDEFIFT